MSKKNIDLANYTLHVYFHLNDAQQYILVQGLTMKDFISNVNKLRNLLFLKPAYEESSYNLHTQLEFIPSVEIADFLNELDNHPLELRWIDFEDEKKLAQLTPNEQAELLYLGHKKEALRPPFYFQLNNQFVYLSEEAEKSMKIYFRELRSIESWIVRLFESKVTNTSKGLFWRKKETSKTHTFPKESIKEMREFAKEGALFSIYRTEKPHLEVGLEIRTIPEFMYVNDVMEEIDEFIKTEPDNTIVFN